MKNFLYMILFIAVISVALTFYAKAEDEENFRLMVFGDSLSAGYRLESSEAFYSQLEKALNDKGYDNVVVINESISGNTSAQGLARVNKALEKKPHAVLLELGINDALRGENLDKTKENLAALIEKFQQNDVPVMLIGMQAPPMSSIDTRNKLTQMYKDLAKKYQLTFYPFFMDGVFIERLGILDLRYLQDDGAHPTAEGVQIMTRKIMPTVEKFLKSL